MELPLTLSQASSSRPLPASRRAFHSPLPSPPTTHRLPFSSTSHCLPFSSAPHRKHIKPSVALTTASSPPSADLESKKHDLLRLVQDTNRGLAATSEQRATIEEAVVCVEAHGAGSEVDLLSLDGTWRLNYTTASDVLVLFEAAARIPFLEVGQIFQKFECKDRTDSGIIRNVVRWSVRNLLEEQEGATLVVSAKFSLLSKRNIYLQFEEVAIENINISEELQALIAPAILPRTFLSLQVAIENINISEELQALIAPAILPRTFLSLQILQFFRTFKAQVPLQSSERRTPRGLYYLSFLDRDMLLGRSVGGGGVFIFTRAQPLS